MINNRTPIDQASEVDPLITGIHCDTRDFAVTYSYTTYTKKDHKEVYWLLHGGGKSTTSSSYSRTKSFPG